MKKLFFKGVRDGIPIFLGYLSVSFGFGILCITLGLSVATAVGISITNLTSAGQFAGLTLIVAAAGLWELILTMLVINSRYALMSLALSQRMGQKIGILPRLLIAFFNTDEIFALGMSREGNLTVSYFIGAGIVAALGWTSGTALGAVAGSLLPYSVQAALGAMLYGMFIAIVVPQARQEKPILFCMALALILSCLFTWVPGLNAVSVGLAIVICTVAAAAVCAWLFPVADEEAAE